MNTQEALQADDIKKSNKKTQRLYFMLILAGVTVIMFASMGRYSYSTVMSEIIDKGVFNKAQAGWVSGGLFFSYAIGQVLFAGLITKLPAKWVLTVSATVCAAINFLMPFCNLAAMMVLWIVNGLFSSVFYMSVIEHMSRCLPKDKLRISGMWMGFALPAGQLMLYGIAAICSKIADWKMVFRISAICVLLVLPIWFWLLRHENQSFGNKEEKPKFKQTLARTSAFWCVFLCSSLACVMGSFIRKTIDNWVPVIMRGDFGIPQSTVYLIMTSTIAISVVGSIGTSWLAKKSQNYSMISAISMGICIALAAIVAIFGNTDRISLLLVNSLLMFLMINIQGLLCGSMMALQMRAYIPSGVFFAVTNASSSVGICATTYGMGNVLDSLPWQTMFLIIAGTSLIGTVILIFGAGKHKKLEYI